MSAERPHKKAFPWIRVVMSVAAVGAIIVLAAQVFDSQLHYESEDVVAGPIVPGTQYPEETFSGKDVPQPINFSHKIHAGDNEINCMYCHTYARRSKVSGIPPLSKCMGCHNVIATEKPEIIKLTDYWNKGESPAWNKVHDLPDFVHFTHQRHLKRFLFDNEELDVSDAKRVCSMCHGDIAEMTVAKKSRPLTMGFCVRCHEANEGPSDCTKCHK